jgi:hypothetical protein
MKTFISLCVVAIVAASAFAGSMPIQHEDREATSCQRLAAKMRTDASRDTWRNRMKVWLCHNAAGSISNEVATVGTGQRP